MKAIFCIILFIGSVYPQSGLFKNTSVMVGMNQSFYGKDWKDFVDSDEFGFLTQNPFRKMNFNLINEFEYGVDSSGIKIGLVGEIGISKDFTNEEEKVLRGAAIAARETKLPLSVHLPGWERHGKKVLDIAKEEGCLDKQIILCHMNPSHNYLDYQKDLADNGAWIEYDMIGMDFYYADQKVQCPYDNENALAIRTLIEDGYINSILLSQDVFIKMMLKKYGGFGYTYILTHFKNRLISKVI